MTDAPIVVGPGPHLLIDDRFVAEAVGVARVTQSPHRPAGAAITDAQSGGRLPAGPTLAYDAERDRFRMWHGLLRLSREEPRTLVAYRESPDGLTWEGPARPLFTFDGYGTNAVVAPGGGPPERRHAFMYFVTEPPPRGAHAAFSPDGLTWTHHPQPVLPYFEIGDPRWTEGVGDILDPYWDPVRRRYGALVKMFCSSDKEFGLQSRTAKAGLGIRLTGHSTSTDFVHWTPPRRVLLPDAWDEGVTEFYGATVLPRGDSLVGLVRILRDDLAATPGGRVLGLGYTALAVSHDGGAHWQRFREPFFDRDPRPGAFDHAMAWANGVARRGDTLYLAYGGYDTGHKRGKRAIGMATLPVDRFAARTAGQMPGTFSTPWLQCRDSAPAGLWLNVRASGGEVRVQARAAGGTVAPGCSFEDCPPVVKDRIALRVKWPGRLAQVGAGPFRLEFRLRNASLYAFSFAAEV